MTYLIDAWLDRPHPYLRILHRETGEVCAVLEAEALDELRDQGEQIDTAWTAEPSEAGRAPHRMARYVLRPKQAGGIDPEVAGLVLLAAVAGLLLVAVA